MNTAAIKRFLMLLSSARNLERERLYQLISAAERCYCLKNRQGQYELGTILETLPEPFNLIGDYYQAFYLYQQGEKDKALDNLSRVLESGNEKYRGKALLTLGAIYQVEGNYDEAMKVRLAASKNETLSVVLDAAVGITTLLGLTGKHANAVEFLEGILPLTLKLGPVPLYFDLRNSYAVELAEQGRTDEALKVIEPVIKSPYTLYYPNWLETKEEIKEKSGKRSMIYMDSNVIQFPTKQEPEPEPPPPPPYDYKYSNFLDRKFNIPDKVDDWVNGNANPDDLGTLFVALAESPDRLERDIIIEKVIETTFQHTKEASKAREKWRNKLKTKMG